MLIMGNNTGIKAVIIDDEIGCINNLAYYLDKYCPDIKIVARGNDLDDARKIIEKNDFDLAFLDIELFSSNIFSILTEQKNYNFKIVFVTAHERYAISAIKVQAVDYILKPLSKQDIIACYTRLKAQFTSNDSTQVNTSELKKVISHKKIVLRQREKVFVINLNDLCYLQAKGAYTIAIFNLNNEYKSVILSKSINKVAEENNVSFLYRVHKSYIVNTERISNIIRNEGLTIKMENNELIPVAKRRVQDFLSFLNNANC